VCVIIIIVHRSSLPPLLLVVVEHTTEKHTGLRHVVVVVSVGRRRVASLTAHDNAQAGRERPLPTDDDPSVGGGASRIALLFGISSAAGNDV
jgi:hypothetical protein